MTRETMICIVGYALLSTLIVNVMEASAVERVLAIVLACPLGIYCATWDVSQ